MPRVPVQVTQQVFPNTPLEYNPTRAVPGAFGGEIAQATQRVGATTEQFGGQLTANAILRQQIQNETDVNDAYAGKYSMGIRNMYEQYYKLQGKDAVDQFPNFEKEMEAYRQQIRDNLANPAQQRMFDTISRRRQQYELDAMSRYADQQNKVYQLTTHKAMLQSYVTMAADKYNDPQARQLALNSGMSEISTFAMDTGMSAEAEHQDQAEFQSAVYRQSLLQQSMTDPRGAYAAFKEEQDKLQPGDRLAVEAHLKARAEDADMFDFSYNMLHSVDVTVGGKTYTAGTGDLQQRLKTAEAQATAYAKATHPDDPLFREHLLQHLHGDFNQMSFQQNQQRMEDRATVYGAFYNEDGSKKTITQLLDDPKTAAAFSDLPPKEQNSVRSALAHADVPIDPLNTQKFQQLSGLRYTNPEEFLREMEDPTLSNTMPHQYMMELLAMQAALPRDAAKRISLNNEVAAVRDMLDDAGITQLGKKAYGKDYNAFVGQYGNAIDQFASQHKRAPNRKEMREIAGGLLAQVKVTGHIFGAHWPSSEDVYRVRKNQDEGRLMVPEADRESITQSFKAHGITNPTEEQIEQAYLQGQQDNAEQSVQ